MQLRFMTRIALRAVSVPLSGLPPYMGAMLLRVGRSANLLLDLDHTLPVAFHHLAIQIDEKRRMIPKATLLLRKHDDS